MDRSDLKFSNPPLPISWWSVDTVQPLLFSVFAKLFIYNFIFFSHCAFVPSRSDVMSSKLGELLLSEPSRYLSILESCEFSTATRASPGGFSYVPLLTNFTFHLRTTMNLIILSSFIL